MTKEYAIGIDLGTTNSCIAVMQNGKAEIITNKTGGRTTPSIIGFTDNEILFGEAAANNLRNDPKNTVYDAKRLIGLKFNDDVIQKDIAHWPFTVVSGPHGKPMIRVMHKGKQVDYFPEQISSLLLKYLKDCAEDFLGGKVTKAVITVPAYFQSTQRDLTKSAGVSAGLEVLRIINEPTAAAVAYGLEENRKDEFNILVFDFGGGTFDVSILSLEEGIFEVKATGGDTHLGGSDLDNAVAMHYAKQFAKDHNIRYEDLKGRPMGRLKAQVENVKRTLSSATSTTLMIDSFYKGEDMSYTVTRAMFEMICKDIFDKLLPSVEKAIEDAKKKHVKNIDEIILVGGSTRIPKVQEIISKHFGGRQLNKTVNPDEVVAKGAAIQAAVLSGDTDNVCKNLLLIDITPLSYGIETVGGVFVPIIPKGTYVPTSSSQKFSTCSDNQTSVKVVIYEGERTLVKDNYKLGEFDLTNIPPAPRGVPEINVVCEIDSNGILSVSATEKTNSNNTNKIVITRDNDPAESERVKRMAEEAVIHKEEDEKNKLILSAYSDLEVYFYQVKNILKKLDEGIQKEISSALNEFDSWVAVATAAPLNKTVEEYNSKKTEMEKFFAPYLQKAAQAGSGPSAQAPGSQPGAEQGPTVEEVN